MISGSDSPFLSIKQVENIQNTQSSKDLRRYAVIYSRKVHGQKLSRRGIFWHQNSRLDSNIGMNFRFPNSMSAAGHLTAVFQVIRATLTTIHKQDLDSMKVRPHSGHRISNSGRDSLVCLYLCKETNEIQKWPTWCTKTQACARRLV